MELTFSPAEQPDIEAIFSLSKNLIDRYEELESIDYDRVLHWVRRKIENNINSYTCIFLDSKKAGYYRFCPSDDCMELDDLYILPEFQHRGIGTAIIRKCCAETSLPVMLYVFTRNAGAFRLYQHLGFRVTKAVGTSRCIMVKEPEVNL